MSSFNPERLMLARKCRGLTKQRLADLTGLTSKSLTDHERGHSSPSATTLGQLAGCLSFPERFFYRRDPEQVSPEVISFRAMSTLTARQRDQGEGWAEIAIEFDAWIKDRFDLPAASVPKLADVSKLGTAGLEASADFIRKEWGLGQQPIGNLIHVLEAHGVRVFSLIEECRNIDAFSFWRDDTPYIFLNTAKTSEHSRMDAAHELGHLVLHHGPHTHANNVLERQAQGFGTAFLMPKSSILATAPRTGRLPDLITAKRYWNVSLVSLIYRMHMLGLLTEWQYRTLFIEASSRGYRRTEPDSAPRETSQILEKVFQAMWRERTTVADIAAELNVYSEDLGSLVFRLVPGSDNPDLDLQGGAPPLRLVQ